MVNVVRVRKGSGRERYTACTLLSFHVTSFEGIVHLSYLSNSHYCPPYICQLKPYLSENLRVHWDSVWPWVWLLT
jgi:hypothetical protein